MGHTELELSLRLIAALAAGALIGLERHAKAKDAGITTHAVLCAAASLLMVISQFAFAENAKFDAARIAAQVVSGVGFLGAGVIFVRHERLQGLTTAAGIFATSAIGLTYGAGLFILASIAALLLIGTHVFFDLPMFSDTKISIRLHVVMDQSGKPDDVIGRLHELGWHNVQPQTTAQQDGWHIETVSFTSKKKNPFELVEQLKKVPHVTTAELLKK